MNALLKFLKTDCIPEPEKIELQDPPTWQDIMMVLTKLDNGEHVEFTYVTLETKNMADPMEGK